MNDLTHKIEDLCSEIESQKKICQVDIGADLYEQKAEEEKERSERKKAIKNFEEKKKILEETLIHWQNSLTKAVSKENTKIRKRLEEIN